MLQGFDKAWIKLCKAKYLKGRDFISHVPNSSNSPMCKGICSSKHLILKGNIYIVLIFFTWPFSTIVWPNATQLLNIYALGQISISEWLCIILFPSTHLGINKQDERNFTLFAVILYDQLWCAMNKTMFEEVEIHPIQLANTINLTYKSHQEAWDSGVYGIKGRIGLFLSCCFQKLAREHL